MTQLNEQEMKLVELISEGCKTPNDITSKLKQLFAGTLEKMLEAEMDEHLGYEKTVFSATTAVTVVMVTGRRQSRVNGAKVKYLYPVTEPEHLSRRLLKNGRLELMIWRLASLQCTKKVCLSAI